MKYISLFIAVAIAAAPWEAAAQRVEERLLQQYNAAGRILPGYGGHACPCSATTRTIGDELHIYLRDTSNDWFLVVCFPLDNGSHLCNELGRVHGSVRVLD